MAVFRNDWIQDSNSFSIVLLSFSFSIDSVCFHYIKIFLPVVVNRGNLLTHCFTFITSSKWATTFLSKQNKSAFFHLINETKSEGSTSMNNVPQLERGGEGLKSFKMRQWTWETLSFSSTNILICILWFHCLSDSEKRDYGFLGFLIEGRIISTPQSWLMYIQCI